MRIGISITKKTPFRDSSQEWSNVYYYDGLAGTPDQAAANNLIDELVTREKAIHTTDVTFVKGRCWSQIGDKTQNEMLSQKDLSGTGSAVAQARWTARGHTSSGSEPATTVEVTRCTSGSGITQWERSALSRRLRALSKLARRVLTRQLATRWSRPSPQSAR